MAIPCHSFSYFARVDFGDGGLLEGTAQFNPARSPEPGPLGGAPSVRIEAERIVMTAAPKQRPRWWMDTGTRLRRACIKQIRWAMHPDFCTVLIAAGDELHIEQHYYSRLLVIRNGHALFAVGPSNSDFGLEDNESIILRSLFHLENPLVPPAGASPWKRKGPKVLEHGSWRLSLLRPKDNRSFSAIWCGFRGNLGIADNTFLAIANRFLEAKVEEDPW